MKLRDQVFRFRWRNGQKQLDKAGEAIIQTARTVNYRLWCVKQAYKLARETGGVSAETFLDVMSVGRANPKDGKSRPSRKIRPVADAVIKLTKRSCSPVLADMIDFQRLTGARPGEVCALRPCDLEMPAVDGEPVWFYVPPEHKTKYAGRERPIVLPPAAVRIVQKYLDRPTTARCFSPREHVAKIGKGGREKHVSDRFTHTTYRRAVEWACKRSGAEAWKPNQLRHRWATEVRRILGIEAVKEGLSHSSEAISEIYAEQSRDRLRAMALRLA